MKKGLSCEGLGRIEDLNELIELAAGIEFEALDVPPVLLRKKLREMTLEELKNILTEKNVEIGSFPSSAWWIDSESVFSESLMGFYEDVKNYYKLGCRICHTFIMPSSDELPSVWYRTTAKRIRIISDILDCFDMKLALEYVGPVHMRYQRAYPFIWNSSQTVDWIRYIDRKNVGLLLDTFHWYCAGETISDLEKIPKECLFHVHVNDAPDVPLEDQKDNKRMYCGEGVIPLGTFMNQLKRMNYQGIAAQEVLCPEPAEQRNKELAERTKEAFHRYLGL